MKELSKFVLFFFVIVAVDILLFSLLEKIFGDLEWASWGMAIFSAVVGLDVYLKYVPNRIPREPIFKNVRDVPIFAIACFAASAVLYLPDWTGDESGSVKLLSTILAFAVSILIIFLLGSKDLRKDFWKWRMDSGDKA